MDARVGAKRVLEIDSSSGYSGLYLAEALKLELTYKRSGNV